MHFRDRGCVRTLRPLFVYATVQTTVQYCSAHETSGIPNNTI